MKLKVILIIVLVLCSFLAIGQPATEEKNAVDMNDPNSINSALEHGNADGVKWKEMNYALGNLDYILINQNSNMVDGDRFIQSFGGSKDLKFSKDASIKDASIINWGADGTISVGADKLAPDDYKNFPAGTQISVKSNNIEITYPKGSAVGKPSSDSEFTINGEEGIKVDGIAVKGKLQAKQGEFWLKEGENLEINNGVVKEIENSDSEDKKILFNKCGQAGICIYDSKLMGEAKGLSVVYQTGIRAYIADAKFETRNQLEAGDVYGLQLLLNELGYKDYEGKALVPDNVLGPRTKSALKEYQQYLTEKGQLASGRETELSVLGPETLTAINRDVGPFIYVDGSAWIKNSDKGELLYVQDEIRWKLGSIDNNYLLNTPKMRDRVYGEHNIMSQEKNTNNPLLEGHREGKYKTVQELINYAYRLAGWDGTGTPTQEHADKAAQIIEDNTGFTLDQLINKKGRDESSDFLFDASVTVSDKIESAGARSIPTKRPGSTDISSEALLYWVGNHGSSWINNFNYVSDVPRERTNEKDPNLPAGNHIAYDLAAPKGSYVGFPDLGEAIGEQGAIYGKVVGIKKGYNGGYGNTMKIELYNKDGTILLDNDGNKIFMETHHHARFNDKDAQLGNWVQPGDNIARVGDSGIATGPHVDVEIYSEGSEGNNNQRLTMFGNYLRTIQP